jgi:signal transduction histidine kinase
MYKILVIDDEEPLRQVVVMALQEKGYETIEAENGEVGVTLAKKHLPDLILSDINMDKMDGYRTLAALRQDPVTAAVPFIIMTGQPHTSGMRHGMELGADDYLAKPFTVSALLAAVEARLKKQEALKAMAEKKLADLRSSISMALPHELFTPLSGIVGFAEIITNEAPSLKPVEISEIGKAILQSAKRLHRLIENFLIYAQIEMIMADPAKEAAINKSYINETKELIEFTARQVADQVNRTTDLRLELTSSGARISDEYLIKILKELLDNAFKFSSAGTPVIISSNTKPKRFCLSVRDFGRGMTPEQIAQIGAYMQFERKIYEQQGSGLGLAITKRLVQIHGGILDIQSEPSKGTTVTVILPSEPDDASLGQETQKLTKDLD